MILLCFYYPLSQLPTSDTAKLELMTCKAMANKTELRDRRGKPGILRRSFPSSLLGIVVGVLQRDSTGSGRWGSLEVRKITEFCVPF